MKFQLSLFLLLFASTQMLAGPNSNNSTNERKALQAKEIVFVGVNYSELKLLDEEGFIGKNGKTKCGALQFKYFEGWNDVFLIEKDKFNLNDLLVVKEYTLFMEPSYDLNKKIVVDDCIINDLDYKVSSEKIQNIVNQYIGLADAEVCVLVIGESLSKKLGKAAYSIVYFDPSDGTILLSNRYEGAPSGYGFDNYWVNALHNCLQDNEKFVKKSRKAYKIK